MSNSLLNCLSALLEGILRLCFQWLWLAAANGLTPEFESRFRQSKKPWLCIRRQKITFVRIAQP